MRKIAVESHFQVKDRRSTSRDLTSSCNLSQEERLHCNGRAVGGLLVVLYDMLTPMAFST